MTGYGPIGNAVDLSPVACEFASNMSGINWNQDTKNKLNDKIPSGVADVASLVRHVVRASKSNELLAQAAKNFASQESVIQNSSESLKKMDILRSQFEFQHASIERSLTSLDDIQDQLKTLQR
ncbi:hypothetical protein ScPMuIL_010973 [Solemya velum]